ncbi:MAG: winged helix-turn-helix domain-containing protein [Caldilineaceae bacterium]
MAVHSGAQQQPLTFEARTVQALLLYLACHGRPLGRDQLAELLWPERSQEQGRANLRVAIHRLRQQLDPYLLITRQTIALNPDAPVTLDVAHFAAQVAAGEPAAATALCHGPFLAGFYLDESPAYEQWALLRYGLRNTLPAYRNYESRQSGKSSGNKIVSGHCRK